jgi:hypothetical protein
MEAKPIILDTYEGQAFRPTRAKTSQHPNKKQEHNDPGIKERPYLEK